MPGMQRRFAKHQHHAPAFIELHIGRAHDQFVIKAVGDAGQAYGIAQWHPPRQKDFTKTTGKDIRGSSLQDQLTFIDWELNNTERNAGRHLKAAKTAEEAAWVMDEYYERSTGAHRQNRINNAVALASTTTTTA